MGRFIKVGGSYIKPQDIRCIRAVEASGPFGSIPRNKDRVLVHHSRSQAEWTPSLGSIFGDKATEYVESVPCDSPEEAAELAKWIHDEIEIALGPNRTAGSASTASTTGLTA